MEQKELDLLKAVLEKKANRIPLTKEENKWANETLDKLLLSKKSFHKVFVVKTGHDTIEKKVDKAIGAQTDKPIRKEKPFNEKPDVHDHDDTSGEVKATEEGEYTNVDNKHTGTEAREYNASDIINSDKDDDERVTYKAGDVVVRNINKKLYAGIIVKLYPKEKKAMVKWASRAFSYVNLADIEKVYDKGQMEEQDAKSTPPIAEQAEPEKHVEPGKGTDEEFTGLDVNKDARFESCIEQVSKNPDVDSPQAVCNVALGKLGKAETGKVTITKEEIAKDNPRLAKSMEEKGHTSITLEINKVEKKDTE